jgi:very-short-patch-repair endonuclease
MATPETTTLETTAPSTLPAAAPGVWECPRCKKNLSSKHNLALHVGKKIPCLPPGVVRRLCCNLCEKSFETKFGLQQHERTQKHQRQVARAGEVAATGMVLEEEQAREAARVAAEEAAEHAARLEPVLAAGCGVCGIQQYRSEALMQLHERSGTHSRAVAKAARAAEAAEGAAVAAENAANSDDDVNPAGQASSSTDPIGDGEGSDEDSEEDGEDVDDRDRDREDLHDGARPFVYCLDDVYRSLGYSRIDSMVRILRSEYVEGKDFKTTHGDIGRTGPAPTKYWMSHHCLAMLTARCRSRNMSRLPGEIELPGGITINHINLYASKEESTIGFMYRALSKTYDCKTQYTFGGSFRADLFIPKARLIVECDESRHKFYDTLHESSRDAAIKRAGFRMYRYNPDSHNFDLASTLGDIFSIIHSVAD